MLIASLIVGGGLGAVARYLKDGYIEDRIAGVFPWGTLIINVSGSLILGVVTGLALEHGLGEISKVAIGTGLCGAFTTFSTFSYETVRLLEEGSVRQAVKNVAISTVFGLAAAALGIALASAI
jgi:CrcB protein